MKRKLAVIAAAVATSLVLVSSAFASYQYAARQSWGFLQTADSSYSTGWTANWFQKDVQGYDTTTTFIDATGYDWHDTVRNTNKTTASDWTGSGETRKAHCKSHTSGFFGSCTVFN